jgi:nucleoside-diphosphate-sugar epimerase
MPSPRIVVTGAAGFLGRHLVDGAKASGANVLSVVRSAETRSDAVAMDALLAEPALLAGTDVLVHAAAIRHRHGRDAASYRASNVDLVEALLRAASRRVRRFVLVSSVGVYGFPTSLPIDERTPFEPRTLYSETKVAAERLVTRLAPELGLDYTIVRPTIIYGPGDTNGMLDKLAAMLRARRYLLVGNGRNTLHHTYVDDVVRGIYTLAASDAAKNDHFILAGPETTTLRRLGEQVADAIGVGIPPFRVPLALARAIATGVDAAARRRLAFHDREPPINNEKLDVMTVSIAFDNAKARGAGFTPSVGYEEGIARTLGSRGAGSEFRR